MIVSYCYAEVEANLLLYIVFLLSNRLKTTGKEMEWMEEQRKENGNRRRGKEIRKEEKDDGRKDSDVNE